MFVKASVSTQTDENQKLSYPAVAHRLDPTWPFPTWPFPTWPFPAFSQLARARPPAIGPRRSVPAASKPNRASAAALAPATRMA